MSVTPADGAVLPPRRVSDADDPQLRDFLNLTDVAARQVREPAAGLFIAEGAKVIGRALAAGLQPRRVICSPRWYDEALVAVLAGHPAGARCEVLLVDPELLRDLTGFRVHRGALASFVRPVPPPVPDVLARAGTILVLVDLVDHTNVGAIFRSAAALGVAGVLVSARCADPWYRRSVKVSMGAVFAVPWTLLPAGQQPEEVLGLLREAGLTTYALTPSPGALDIWEVATGAEQAPSALLIGTEGPGLPDCLLAAADLAVRIPMHNGVDSLNVATAAAIACHHFAGRAP